MTSVMQKDDIRKSQIQICQSVRQKYPHMVPIFLQTHKDIKFKKEKLLVSKQITGVNFIKYITTLAQKSSTGALYIFIQDKQKNKQFLFQSNMTFDQIYERYKNPQTGYLHVLVLLQQSF